jgi:hypothetical protein
MIISTKRRFGFETLEKRNMMAVIPGDYDFSGVVDQNDYVLWKSEFGNTESPADGSGNGMVDAADYTIWRDNLGKTLADVPPDPPQTVTAAMTGPTSVQITWQAVAGATSYNVQRRRPNVTNDPFVTVGSNILATTFTDLMVAAGTVYEYQLIAQNTAGTSQPSQTTSVTAGQSNLTAFRPQYIHDPENLTNAPIYFPFARTQVAEQDESSASRGPGIRINRDDDNGNGIVDRFESGIPIPEENDLIEVRIDRLPGQGDLVLEVGEDLQVFATYDKEQLIPFDDEGVFTEPLPFVDNVYTVFVEWIGNNHGTDFIRLADATTMAILDTVQFHTFTSLTVVLGGFTQVPSIPTDPNHGMFLIADELYRQGFDVLKFDEDEVSDGITGGGNAGEGIPYDEIANAVNNRLVEEVALLGYSQGGGSVYNLSQWLDHQNFLGDIGPYNLVFTAYVDAVRDDGPFAEDRLPTNTLWHLNLYQNADTSNLPASSLHGTTVAASNEDIDVETSPQFNLPNVNHAGIDDNLLVRDWVILRHGQNVIR